MHVRHENQNFARFDEKISRYSDKSVALLLFNVRFGVLLENFELFMLCNKEFGTGNALNRLVLVSCDTPTCFVQ